MAIAGREGLWEIMTDWEGRLYIQTENFLWSKTSL